MRKYLNRTLISLAVGLLVSALFLGGALERLELLTIDLRYRTLGGSAQADSLPVAVVALDQNSLKGIGRWPIPRDLYVIVLQHVYDDGAKGVLMDMDFSSRGPDPARDEALVNCIRRARTVVLAAQMDERVTKEGVLLRNVTMPYQELKNAAMALGGITFEVDPDGVVRRMPHAIDFIDEVFEPLGAVGATMIKPGLVPSAQAGALMDMKFLARPEIPVIPFQKLLEGDFKKGLFRDRVVLLGATSPDLHDLWLTPYGVIPGVFIQAAVLDTALNGSWYRRQGNSAAVLGILLFSILAGWVMGALNWRGGAVALALFLAAAGGWAFLDMKTRVFLQVVPLFLVALTMYPVQIAARVRRTDITLKKERGKTEVLLSLSDLRLAEEEGQEPHLVPLVLLGRFLGLTTLQVYTTEDGGNRGPRTRTVIGDPDQMPDPALLAKALKENVCLTEILQPGRCAVVVPMATVRKTLGVLYAETGKSASAVDEEARLLLFFGTQTAYFLESRALDLRIKDLYVNTIRAISRALDSKDQYTSAHSELSLDHVEKLGRMCGLDREQIESLHVGALLHDIGKIGVPDTILAKAGTLSSGETRIIMEHPVIGSDIVRGLPFPEDVKRIIRHHHERFDGTGYPDGLKGKEIPLLVRIFSILDVYEALVGSRPYRKPLDREEAVRLIRDGSGTQFDPQIVDIFLKYLAVPEEFSKPDL